MILILFAMAEAGAHVVSQLAPSWLGREILTRSMLLARHAQVLERILDPPPRALGDFDAALGWRTRPGTRTRRDRINASGLRGDREYSPLPEAGVLRVAVFGDSFVYGSEVRTEQSWPASIESRFPDIEVLNYGVPAYGTDQAYLRFAEEGLQLSPHVAVLTVTPVALRRILSVFTSFRSHESSTPPKPRFRFAPDGGLELIPNPVASVTDLRAFVDAPMRVKEWGRFDYWYEPLVYENPLFDHLASVRLLVTAWSDAKRRYLDRDRPIRGAPGRGVFNADSSAFRILTAIADRFVDHAEGAGVVPLILVLPDEYSVMRRQQGLTGVCAPFLKSCASGGRVCLDGGEAFTDDGVPVSIEGLFRPKGHYSHAGNLRVAEWLAVRLRQAASQGLDAAP